MDVDKRTTVKWVRDLCKRKVFRAEECYICGATETLAVHHFSSVATVIEDWAYEHKASKDKVLEWRDQVIKDKYHELVEDVITLCKKHHIHLHSIFGETPSKVNVTKQRRWIEIQREKHGKLAK